MYAFDGGTRVGRPLYLSKIRAGFPSPADDYIDKKLDLNEYLVKHPAATFYVKVEGNSMVDAGIRSGDILIVDRALEVADGKIIVAVLNGEFTVKRIKKKRSQLFLMPENPDYPPIEVKKDSDFKVWGVVTAVIHHM
ncbi:MAG: peptidase S24 [Lentisphaerae bacterium GWF2_52_8]|nr:MAG: peptidase S24 [Lentisphaerae bacterium GWF2_52_8]